VAGWGYNNVGQITIPAALTDAATANVIAIAAGNYHNLALRKDGTVVGWGSNDSGESMIPAALTDAATANVIAIAGGSVHSLAIRLQPQYNFIGFQSPVDNLPAVNTGKAGKTYPVKWQLQDGSGNFITTLDAVTSITYQAISCGNFSDAPADPLEVLASGGTGLRYDTTANQYIYNWKTPGAGCYVLSLALKGGQVFSANFNLSK
jgi:hypothetical protein